MKHLIAISVGPVQEFIAAARRTRDLWFGSYLLSEISRSVAKSVKEQNGELIFPQSLDAENVANIILAEVDSDDVRGVVANARQAAKDRWLVFANAAKRQADGVIRADVWTDQVDDVIEFYAAWLPRGENYSIDRRQVMRLLGGRKSFRDFLPAIGRAGLPKSSLDGQRETVLLRHDEWRTRFREKLRIRDGEQLDVVGMVKRLGDGNHPFPSVSRIAADPWIRGNQEKLLQVSSACTKLAANEMLHQLNANAFPEFAKFPFEGSAVYKTRHSELLEETNESGGRDLSRLSELRTALERLPEPNPYLAILVADGDKMGAALSGLANTEENRQFSSDLASFGGEADRIVRQHNGVLVYAGGDDVLAFLPVDKCLSAARLLHDVFATTLKNFGSPTLSVGIAIGHFMENLEDLLSYGRAAEHAAKNPDRDGLAVHLHKRGGAPIRMRAQWSESSAPDVRLLRYAHLIRCEAIPSKLAYEFRGLSNDYQGWPEDGSLASALQQDVLRIVSKKQPKPGNKYMSEVESIVNDSVCDTRTLLAFSDDLLIAKQIAVGMSQANEPKPTIEELVH